MQVTLLFGLAVYSLSDHWPNALGAKASTW